MLINKTLNKINEWRCLGSGEQCYSVMYAITRAFQVKRILEIGTHQGASAITFCQAILDNGDVPELWTVDSWAGFEGNEATYNLKEKTKKHFKAAGFDKYIHMVEGDSKIVVPDLMKKEVGMVDMCFIDGDHSSEAVIADYNNCKNYTHLILFHDCPIENVEYLRGARNEGWNVLSFPTRYAEGDRHLVGITLAKKY